MIAAGIAVHYLWMDVQLNTPPFMPQAAGGAVKTGLDYVGVGLGYAKSVRYLSLRIHMC